MRLTVIGCGYVGLVTGACLAAAGHEVYCTDIDEKRIEQLKAGKVPIYEEHLEEVLKRAAAEKKIFYTSDAGEAIRAGDVIFICVGTPPKESGEADLSAIDHVARQVATEARTSKLVVEKSTVPALTGVQLQKALAAYSQNGSLKFEVASNPEFLREGTAVGDFFHPDRIVVGVEDEKCAATMREIYSPILERKFHCPVHAGKCPSGTSGELLITTINSAELIKHASNSFLALKISYANVISDLCERIGADVEEVTHAMGLDPRIGTQFLKAGLGFGGFCFPKDIQAFIHLSSSMGVEFDMLKAAESVAEVHASDPEAISRTKPLLPSVKYHEDPYEALKGVDAALVCTEWQVFRKLDWEKAGQSMARRLVIDGRNLYSHKKMQELGFDYYSFGRR